MNTAMGRLIDLDGAVRPDRVDLFIGSASFEERCQSVLKHIDDSRIRRGLVAVNRAFGGRLRESREWFQEVLGDRVEFLDVYSHDPIASLLSLRQSVCHRLRPQPRSVVVDITAFTGEPLIMLIGLLDEFRQPDTEVTFVYATASQDSVGSSSDSSRWLSAGVRDIRPVLGFTGHMRPSRHTHMIVMVGLEDERALEVIRSCEPAHVSLGARNPSEPGTRSRQATNEQGLSRLLSVLPDVRIFQFLGYDAGATETALQAQIDAVRDCNVVIVPMNTNISTVGAALLALRNRRIQVCYATPCLYNLDDYSRPGDDFYLFSLPAVGGSEGEAF